MLTEWVHMSNSTASIYIFIRFILDKYYLIGYFLCDECRHCVQDVSGDISPVLQGQDSPEVNCQNDLSGRDAPHKMSGAVTMFGSPFDAMWHACKGHTYNILSCRKWPIFSKRGDRWMAAGAIRRPRLDTGHLTDVHCSVAVRVWLCVCVCACAQGCVCALFTSTFQTF